MRPNAADVYDDLSGNEGARRGGWLDSLIPQPLLERSLAVSVRAPETIVAGRPARIEFRVSNRLPIPVKITLPTSRLWGWRVDGIDEADRRAIDPPDEPRTLAFAHLETRTFATSWDGLIRRPGEDGDRWEPATGERTLEAYLATEPPLSDETVVTVRTPR